MDRVVLQLVPAHASQETVAVLRDMLGQAERGEIIGLAFVAMRVANYTVDAVGLARRSPVVARGMLADLKDLLRDLQLDRRR